MRRREFFLRATAGAAALVVADRLGAQQPQQGAANVPMAIKVFIRGSFD